MFKDNGAISLMITLLLSVVFLYVVYVVWEFLLLVKESLMGKRKDIACPNCGKRVKYGSQHCRGRDEISATWICKRKK